MDVVEIWRFPVKSLGGERLERVAVDEQGLEGDRGWAIWDVEGEVGLTARRVPELLFASSRLGSDGSVEVVLPSGEVAGNDAALADWLGRRVELRSAADAGSRRFENTTDFEREADAPWRAFEGAPAGRFHDSERARVSLVSQGSIGGWDRRRFRANVLLGGAGENELVGGQVRIGGAVLRIEERITRCVMVTRPQPDGIPRDLEVLRRIARERDGQLAIGATVELPGTMALGDRLERIVQEQGHREARDAPAGAP